jgi:hypothetical protein
MVTLRCTAKLLARLGIERRPPDLPPPTNALGDWYGDIIVTRPSHLVLFLSERSGLSVILEARHLDTLVPRFLRRLEELLASIGASPAAIERELAATSDLAFGATTNQKAVGLLTWAVRELRHRAPLRPDMSVYEWSIEYSERPCGNPLRIPSDVALELLTPASKLTLVRGGAT